MVFKTRRFFFNGIDPLQLLLNQKEINFMPKQGVQQEMDIKDNNWTPYTDENLF